MAQEVLISYSRSASSAHAEALAAKLGNVAFFDSVAIPDGDEFPPRLLNAVLNARVIVILATESYSERPFCRLEMRLALAADDLTSSHIVLALGEGAGSVLDALPQSIASQNWPPSGATDLLEGLVRDRLTRCSAPLRSVLVEADARRLAAIFLEESNIPEARSLDGIVCSLPQGIASQSIGSRFVGRAGELRRIHQILTDGSGSSARLTIRITAGAGFGKTRLATEYLYRYGPRYYPGGLFWVKAASSSIDDEFWRILSVLDREIPNLAAMREQKRNVRRELERALRGIHAPVLYVIDNIPEAGPGEDAPPMEDFCPALGAVTVLATSRQDTREEGVKTISVDTLVRDAAILLLTDNLPGAGRLSWNDWDRIANWVGDLPLVLDLLNCCLALSSIPFEELLQRATTVPVAASEVEELDHLRDALRGQIPRDSVRGVGEAFAISFEKLSDLAKESAMILAQLAPAPIPEALIDAMHEDWKSPAVRAALHSRHYVIAGGNLTFGVMHRLLADFLRNQTGDLAPKMLEAACMVVDKCMTKRAIESRMRGLRPQRGALCKFEGVIIPSDLHGLTTIQIEPYVYTPSPRNKPRQAAPPLPSDAIARLEAWLACLSPVAANVPSAHLLHGYSGTWRIVTEFRKWHDYVLQRGDKVTVSGTMFLQLNVDGRNGSGTMFGTTEVMLNHGAYRAWYRFDNDIDQATVNDHGQLMLDVRIVERVRIGREGRLPEELKELEDSLPGSRRFPVILEPDLQKPGLLKGTHSYLWGIRETFQEADEQYTYVGPALQRDKSNP